MKFLSDKNFKIFDTKIEQILYIILIGVTIMLVGIIPATLFNYLIILKGGFVILEIGTFLMEISLIVYAVFLTIDVLISGLVNNL